MKPAFTRASASPGMLALGLESQAHAKSAIPTNSTTAAMSSNLVRARAFAAARAGERAGAGRAGFAGSYSRPPLVISTSKPGPTVEWASSLPILEIEPLGVGDQSG